MASEPDKFSELEARILRTIELVKTTRKEKEQAEKALIDMRSQVAQLDHELEQLRRERDLVKNKVESLLERLSELTEETLV